MLLNEGVEAYKKEGPKFIQRLVAKQKARVKRLMTPPQSAQADFHRVPFQIPSNSGISVDAASSQLL